MGRAPTSPSRGATAHMAPNTDSKLINVPLVVVVVVVLLLLLVLLLLVLLLRPSRQP